MFEGAGKMPRQSTEKQSMLESVACVHAALYLTLLHTVRNCIGRENLMIQKGLDSEVSN